MGHKSALICYTTHFSILLYHRRLPTTTRPDRADTEEKGRTEAPPPFCRSSGKQGGGLGQGLLHGLGHTLPPPYGGRFRPNYPCGKAPNTDAKRALTRRRKAP